MGRDPFCEQKETGIQARRSALGWSSRRTYGEKYPRTESLGKAASGPPDSSARDIRQEGRKRLHDREVPIVVGPWATRRGRNRISGAGDNERTPLEKAKGRSWPSDG
jgi:hypothetical protein